MKILGSMLALLAVSLGLTDARFSIPRAGSLSTTRVGKNMNLKQHAANDIRASELNSQVLNIPRGGDANAKALVKGYALLTALSSFLLHAAPKLGLELYGVKNPKQNDAFARYVGQMYCTGLMLYGIQIFAMVDRRMTYMTAMRVGNLGMLYNNLCSLLSGSWKDFASKPSGLIVATAIHALMVYALTQDYAKKAALASIILWVVGGLILIVDPKQGLGIWGANTSKMNSASRILARALGVHLVAACALFYSMMSKNVGVMKATGYGALIWTGYFVSTFFDKDVKDAGVLQSAAVFWLILEALVAAATLL